MTILQTYEEMKKGCIGNGLCEMRNGLCQTCQASLKASLDRWREELEEREFDLVDNISEQEYLSWVLGYLNEKEKNKGITKVTEERLENVKKDYLKKKERIKELKKVLEAEEKNG